MKIPVAPAGGVSTRTSTRYLGSTRTWFQGEEDRLCVEGGYSVFVKWMEREVVLRLGNLENSHAPMG